MALLVPAEAGRMVPIMSLSIRTFAAVPALLLGLSWSAPALAQETNPQPDNTKTNKRDRPAGAVTADQQKMNSADRDLTKKSRQAVIADKSLSTYAHNIKIVSQDGTV